MAAVTVNAQARRSTSIASPKSGALLRSTSSLGHEGTLSSRHCIHARHGVKAKELTIKGALMARSTLQAACRAAGDRRIAGWSTKQQASPTPKRRGDMPGTRLDVFIKRKRSQWKVQLGSGCCAGRLVTFWVLLRSKRCTARAPGRFRDTWIRKTHGMRGDEIG